MNSTCDRATGRIPYEVVFRREPSYLRVPVDQRPFSEVDFREILDDFGADSSLDRT